ncbi:MAG: aspartyl/asparaginyl beta-hydroxylase domain-containing protein [Caulobacteraceae bacterium]|nr:aspartyl/asparaginyl beta-hydroxylase domain-containing protein [Caulobacter sp.]
MLKGDHLGETGDAVAAAAFYGAVVQLGGEGPSLPPDLQAEVARARAAVATHSSEVEAFLVAELRRAGLDGPGGRRVRDSLDMMLGKKRIYLQEPTQYYFPELPQVAFYDRDALPWLDPVEAATDAIREELHAVLADDDAFLPYVEGAANRPAHDRGPLYGDPSWSAFYLIKAGEPVAGNAERCPRTLAALADVPLCAIPGRTPQVLFSLLRPGARIPPHTGLLNTRLICHLPLIAPQGCGFRVGHETRSWVEGRAWAFDDSIEHEAWNESGSLRVVLIFDVWRPELTATERDLVSVMVAATKRVGRGPDA